MKQREILKEPALSSRIGAGFDLEVDSNVAFHGDSEILKPKARGRTSLKEKFIANSKLCYNIVACTMKCVFENLTLFRPPADFLDNLANPKMNNLEAIDYANKDFTHDSDQILARWTQEFPRLS
jgi:hypothetical protein